MNFPVEKARTKHLDDLHFEHQLWLSAIRFYKDELQSFRKRLEEIAFRNTSREAGLQVEHFQNQFTIHITQLDILKHDISLHENELAAYAKDHPVAVDHVLFSDHITLRERNDREQQLYMDLKKDFIGFMDKWM